MLVSLSNLTETQKLIIGELLEDWTFTIAQMAADIQVPIKTARSDLKILASLNLAELRYRTFEDTNFVGGSGYFLTRAGRELQIILREESRTNHPLSPTP